MSDLTLVVGGAGYIGSHMVKLLRRQGRAVVALDNLSAGHRDAVLGAELVVGDAGDRALLDRLLSARRFGAVMHFASLIQVGESVTSPGRYYRNNLCASLGLLDAMVAHGVPRFIFSSTAAIFGEPRYVPIDEAHPAAALSAYGRSKWMVEQALPDYERAHGLRHACLRYFNAAGADPEGEIGERHEPETHLIPLVLQAAAGQRDAITVFGRDYDTPDGTCVRDYVHVEDLCRAHLAVLDHLEGGGASCAYNLGNGRGFSVAEVIEAARRVTGRPIAVREAPRRPGDPARLVADSDAIKRELGWAPRYPNVEVMLEHAWRFARQRGTP